RRVPTRERVDRTGERLRQLLVAAPELVKRLLVALPERESGVLVALPDLLDRLLEHPQHARHFAAGELAGALLLVRWLLRTAPARVVADRRVGDPGADKGPVFVDGLQPKAPVAVAGGALDGDAQVVRTRGHINFQRYAVVIDDLLLAALPGH